MPIPVKSFRLNLDSLLAIFFIIAYVIPYISFKGRGDVISFVIFFLWLTVVIFKKDQIYKILYTLSLRKFE